MNIKSATKFAFIGAIILAVVFVIYFLLNSFIISIINERWIWENVDKFIKVVNCILDALQILSAVSFAIFFGVLHKNQK